MLSWLLFVVIGDAVFVMGCGGCAPMTWCIDSFDMCRHRMGMDVQSAVAPAFASDQSVIFLAVCVALVTWWSSGLCRYLRGLKFGC